jgi:Flp pilus assembly pilin Flp
MAGRVREERGQGLVEYALLLVLVSIAIVILLSVVGVDLKEMFDAVENLTGDPDNGEDPVRPIGDDNATADEARGD